MKEYINIDDVAKRAAKEAIKEFQKQELKRQRKQIYHNVDTLLKNYNSFKEHYNNAISNIEDIEIEAAALEIEDFMQGSDKAEIFISSIKKSKLRTGIMIQHIEVALEILKNGCKRKGKFELDKYYILEGVYLKEMTFVQLSENFNCSEMTIRRWKNEMINQLGVLLFGVDAMC
ncbi:hypothetical protein [Acetoanaerobium noterae]|uniref:hypothetical protein n=1 Tax=Acetoanaerobium noterae TaxID=745369 RepID=UPI00333F00B3